MFKIRILATVLMACAIAVPALAQEPLPGERRRRRHHRARRSSAEQGRTRPPKRRRNCRGHAAMPEGNPLKLSAGDFKNFFSADTGKTLAYVSMFAIASAPVGSRRRQQRLQHSDHGVPGRQPDRQFRVPDRRRFRDLRRRQGDRQPESRPRRPRHRPRAGALAGDGAEPQVHGPPRASGRQQPAVVPVGTLLECIRHGHRAASSLRLEDRRARVRARQLRRARAHVVEPPPCHRCRDGRGLRHRLGAHRDDDASAKSKFNLGVQPQVGGASVNFTKIYK